MKFIKKVSVSTLDTSGRIIDSLNTPDNPHINAPSLAAVKSANAATAAEINEIKNNEFYSDGETITFSGDGFYSNGGVIPGVWNIDTAYLAFTPRKKLKANQTVTAEIIAPGMITLNNSSMGIYPSGVPTSYSVYAENYPEINQIVIKIVFTEAHFNFDGVIAFSGGGIRLTIHD